MKRFKMLVGVVALAMIVGCGSDVEKKGGGVSVNGATNSNTSDGGTNAVIGEDAGMETPPDATMSSEDAPVIVELSAAPTRLTEDEFTTISAVVTDAQGPQDIVAGRLLDGQTQALIGNFTSLAGGSFEIEVTWAELDGVRPITFGAGGTTRAVTAEFIDNANERSTRSLSLNLTCNGLPACEGSCGLERCDGACVDPVTEYLDNDANCGSCGNACAGTDVCNGSSCGVAPPTAVGAACETSEDCGGVDLICLTESEFGFPIPGGYCSLLICDDGDCGAGAECVNFRFDGGALPICGKSCASIADCRSGYDCVEYERSNSNGSESVCAF